MESFVEREEEMDDAIATLRDFGGPGVDGGVVWDVVGISGIGKRTLLKRVAKEAKSVIGRDLVVFEDDVIGPFVDAGGMLGDCGPGATAQALLSTLERSSVIMRALADYFRMNGNPSSFDDFILQCEDWLHSGQRLMRDRRNSANPSAVPATEHADRAELRVLQRKMDDTFVVGWAQAATHPVLITLNSFGKLVDDELGNWTLTICPRLTKTLTLLARVPSEGAAVLEPDSSRISKNLPYFTAEQARTFLEQRFVGVELHPQLATIVHNYTDGHPGGLDLVTKLIMETKKGSGISPEELRRLLDRLPENINERWAGVIDIIVDVVDDPLLRKAVNVVSVTHWFDDALLGCLLEINHRDEDDTIDAGEALKRLRAFGLVQLAEDRPGTFRLVEFIRQSLATKMYTTSLQRWQELHQAAASHYMQRLEADEADESEVGSGEYGQWYRYERPGWQADKLQWLYHSGQLTEKRELTRAMFLLVFLEAFYWYGCYVHFDFIPRLIEDWERASRLRVGERPEVIQEDVELATALAFLVDAYPLGHLKPATAPWAEIQARILQAQGLCGLDSENISKGLADAELRNLARANALVETFVAHTWRFKDPRDPRGRRCYENALRLVDELDNWLACWIVFESADLALEAGRVEDAIALLQVAIVRALEMQSAEDSPVRTGIVVNLGVPTRKWDYELLANLHRLHADARWHTGDRSAVASAYGKAVTNAYWFQGDPHPPDSYTQQFYAEMTSRVSQRVAELQASGSDQVDAFVAGVTAELPELPTPGSGNGELVPFPQAPSDDDYDTKASTFMDEWRKRKRERVDPAAELRALLPDAGE